MKVKVTKLTDIDLMHKACEMTMHGQKSKISLDEMYLSEHSPARTQLFWIELYGIPTFVSVHLVRHKYGVEHFVRSNREDRGGGASVDRNSPVNHGMLINAQAIINISKERLCQKTHENTRYVWKAVIKAISRHDKLLARHCVPKCLYRSKCPEPQSCHGGVM